MLFLSPRNSPEAQYAVVDEAKCHIWLCSVEMKDRLKVLVDQRPKAQSDPNLVNGAAAVDLLMVVPDQDELLKDEHVPEFPWEKTVEEARSETFVLLHTSR